MAANLRQKQIRTTRASLDSQAGSSGLLEGEIYLITDENKIAIGLSTSTYEVIDHKNRYLTDNRLNNYNLCNSFDLDHRTPNREVVTLATGESYIHGFIWAKGKIYATTRTSPAKLLRFNNPEDLTDYDVYTWANDGYHGGAECIIYSETKDKLYIVFNHNSRVTVSEVDPDGTLASTDVVSNTTAGAGFSPALATDETYLYVLSNLTSSAKILQYNMSTWALSNSASTTYQKGHALVYDGTYLYATGMPTGQGWVSRFDTSTLAETAQLMDADDDYPTDDLIEIGDYLWAGLEDGEGHILKIKKSDLTSQEQVSIASGFGTYSMCYDGEYLWTATTGSPGTVYRIDPNTHEIYSFALETGENIPNEIITDGQRLFITCWLAPAKVIRVTNPKLTYVSSQISGSSAWGSITGTLSDQTDLQGALDAKSATTHNHDSDYADISHTHTESQITDLGAYLENVVEDTTPQLGGSLDLNGKSFTETLTAGESVVAGDICYLKAADGKYWKADASAEATAATKLAMATASISADATGTFLIYGVYTTTGLTAGNYYLSETAGAMTATAPTTSGAIIRILGTAESTTKFFFNPDTTYLELT